MCVSAQDSAYLMRGAVQHTELEAVTESLAESLVEPLGAAPCTIFARADVCVSAGACECPFAGLMCVTCVLRPSAHRQSQVHPLTAHPLTAHPLTAHTCRGMHLQIPASL